MVREKLLAGRDFRHTSQHGGRALRERSSMAAAQRIAMWVLGNGYTYNRL